MLSLSGRQRDEGPFTSAGKTSTALTAKNQCRCGLFRCQEDEEAIRNLHRNAYVYRQTTRDVIELTIASCAPSFQFSNNSLLNSIGCLFHWQFSRLSLHQLPMKFPPGLRWLYGRFVDVVVSIPRPGFCIMIFYFKS